AGLPQRVGAAEEFVKVRRRDLERLTAEVMQIRDFLPRVLDGEVLESFQKLRLVEKSLERKEQELEQLRVDCEHLRARLESVQADSVRERKEKLALRQQLNEAKQQLLQQAEYCTEMGAAACTLLWGVSSSEDVVKAILGGVSTPLRRARPRRPAQLGFWRSPVASFRAGGAAQGGTVAAPNGACGSAAIPAASRDPDGCGARAGSPAGRGSSSVHGAIWPVGPAWSTGRGPPSSAAAASWGASGGPCPRLERARRNSPIAFRPQLSAAPSPPVRSRPVALQVLVSVGFGDRRPQRRPDWPLGPVAVTPTLPSPCLADVAAIACGREFLVNSSRVLLDTILQLLGDLKPGQCTKLKV
ncbi:PREDICTED: heat shock factor 2-binding protein, partial [Condylura cristata]|uniref:heat shock factor 2-binding protein n=1 Tax=Condylura cristata TaxID=143302 RepID=UPI000642B0AC